MGRGREMGEGLKEEGEFSIKLLFSGPATSIRASLRNGRQCPASVNKSTAPLRPVTVCSAAFCRPQVTSAAPSSILWAHSLLWTSGRPPSEGKFFCFHFTLLPQPPYIFLSFPLFSITLLGACIKQDCRRLRQCV